MFVERQGGTGGLPNPGGFPVAAPTDDPATAQQKVLANVQMRRQMEAFMLAFDSNLAPIVGQQATLAAWSGADAQARVDLLEARAAAGECEVVVHGVVRGDPVGFLYQPASGLYCRIAPAAARSATPPCARWRARAR